MENKLKNENIVFVFEINYADFSDNIYIKDPDNDILDAKFFDLPEVLEMIRSNPIEIIKVPLLEYLEKKTGFFSIYKMNMLENKPQCLKKLPLF